MKLRMEKNKNSAIFLCVFLFFVFYSCAKKTNVRLNYREIDIKALEIMKIAKDHHQKRNYYRARKYYRKVIKEYPESNYADDAQFYIARVFHEKESYMRARDEYEKLAEDFPSSDKIQEAMQYLYEIGEMYWRKGKRYDAVDVFKKAIEIYPFGKFAPDIQFRIANYYFEEKEYKDAVINFEKLLRLYPDYPAKMLSEYKLGVSYFEASLHWALDQDYTNRAIFQFNKIIQLYPDNPYIYEAQKKIEICKDKLAKRQYRIAEFYLDDDKYEAARIYYKNVISEYPETEWGSYAQFGIAETFRKEKQWDKAITAYRKLMEDNPESKLSDKVLDRIDNINRKIVEEKKEK